jgi:hypothetical protein
VSTRTSSWNYMLTSWHERSDFSFPFCWSWLTSSVSLAARILARLMSNPLPVSGHLISLHVVHAVYLWGSFDPQMKQQQLSWTFLTYILNDSGEWLLWVRTAFLVTVWL